jgi:hypothetical protein
MTMIERPTRRTRTPSQRELDNTVDAEWWPIPRYVLWWRAIVRFFYA